MDILLCLIIAPVFSSLFNKTSGWILLALQVLAGSHSPTVAFITLLVYYLPGIIGICLLVLGYSKRSKAFDDDVEKQNLERACKREAVEKALNAFTAGQKTSSSVSNIYLSRGNRDKY